MHHDEKRNRAWLDDGDMQIESDAVTELLDLTFAAAPAEGEARQVIANVKQALAEEMGGVLYYDVISSTPFGPIYIAVSSEGLAAVGFDDSEQDFLTRMHKRYRASLERSRSQVTQVAEQLKEYFAGRRLSFDIKLDLNRLRPFQRAVLEGIQRVPAGETVSYGDLARRIGKPGSARAVGRALGSNPIPIIIPCHRALAADGSLGGYSGRGGVRTKQALLILEGAWE